ncbi:hypothetical protein HG535_0C03720 [Zygotorulaspora mrakii]|uniref:Chromatin modification-related protein n=1 Tax=Zygotorulaspora mrakii TaxID=42260 RepID=A0A7H9B205_ZYGMR|nr:uncharacterized protein HG535_0C03720 [Zygotorulaspora mrakii]QLG72019.1 hypothetical protein HG535_0C03720 [Zygotorulaspora mrakii]
MDPSSVLEQTTQDVSNLPSEFHHILNEIRSLDTEIYDVRKKTSMKDSQMQKYIKQNGSLSVYSKEEEFTDKIRDEISHCKKLQMKKCTMANTALFLVTKHLAKLEKSIIILEEDGLLAPLEDETDSFGEYSRETSVMSSGERRKRKPASSGSNNTSVKRRKPTRTAPSKLQDQEQEAPMQIAQSAGNHTEKERQNTVSKKPTNENSLSLVNRDTNFDLPDANDDLFSSINTNEEEDKTLYCFCQSVSYGEMVACDGEHCKFEWFHYSCVNLKEPPKGAWFCPDCRQQMNKRQ